MDTKVCRRCGETKPLNEMVKNSKRKSGIDARCKSCDAAKSRARYNSAYHLFKWHRRRAAQQGTGTYITYADFAAIRTAPDRECMYCGSTDGLTIDHVLPLLHYGPNTRWNIVSACLRCNSRKRSRTVIEFYEMSDAFTSERFDALIAHMAEHNNCSTEHMHWLLTGYHAGEMWSKEMRKKRQTA